MRSLACSVWAVGGVVRKCCCTSYIRRKLVIGLSEFFFSLDIILEIETDLELRWTFQEVEAEVVILKAEADGRTDERKEVRTEDVRADGRTDERTDGRTDGLTDLRREEIGSVWWLARAKLYAG